MRKSFVWIVLSIFFLASCAVETAQSPGLEVADDPVVATPTLLSTPTVEAAVDAPPDPTDTPVEVPTETPAALPGSTWVAFIGQDGNLRLVERASGETRDITTDASPLGPPGDETTIRYEGPRWSSDGMLLSFKREIIEPVEGGIETSSEIWLFELDSANLRRLSSELRISTTAWQPGTHVLAYTSWLDDNYFSARGQIDSTKAIGVWGIDADTGETLELVPPENGYSLSWIKWSPDGRYLLFHEVLYYEGAGSFGYYDLETDTYTATQEIIGSTDLSPDNQTLAYDSLTYVATGGESIFLRPLEGGEPQQFSPDYELGYAFNPLFSPTGDEIAYLAEIGSLETGQYTVIVQAVDGGEPLPLGTYESANNLAWLPDASGLVLSAGPYESSQILEISILDGTSRVLAEGREPALQPAQP